MRSNNAQDEKTRNEKRETFDFRSVESNGEHPAPNTEQKSLLSSRSRSASSLGFTEISTGLPSKGDFSYIAMGDFNKDSDIDIAFGGEDWSVQDSQGLFAFTGNGGTGWTNSTNYLWQGNSWGGLQMVDADEDGAMELYATDEDWGSKNNSGVKVWEYRSGSWTDNSAFVSSPDSSGQPCNVILTNVTGDSKLDMLVNGFNGIRYYENTGGNPISWSQKSSGLPTNNWYTGAALGDLNKDGLKDLVSTRNDQERMWVQSTSGNLWQEYSSGITTSGYMVGVAIDDVNSDGHNDIVFGTSTPSDGYGLKVWLGNSGGGSGGTSFSWTAANTGLPTLRRYAQIQLVDIDNDGDLDIIGPCASGSEGMQIFLGNGSDNPGKNLGWTKAANTGLPTTGNWYGANVYDINGDGSLDIVGASWGMGVRAWLNNISFDMVSPAAVTDLTVTDITTTSLTVNWTAPADDGSDAASGPAAEYDIRYSTDTIDTGNWGSALRCNGEPVPAQPGIEQSFTLNGLSSGTKYYVALRSSDERPNFSPLSNIVSGATLGLPDDTLPGKITDLSAGEPTNNSINLTWTAPADNGTDASSGPVSSYDIKYHTGIITELNWDTSYQAELPPVPSMPGLTEIYTVSGLAGDTTYYFAVKASDERPNRGPLSNVPHETTLIDPDLLPPAAIIDLGAINPTVSSLELAWTAPGDDGDTGTASEYDIRYAAAEITDITWDSATAVTNAPVPQEAGNVESLIVNGLQAETKYYFAVRTADENSLWSPLSNSAYGTTLPLPDETEPAPITDLAAKDPKSSSITLTWTAPGDDGGTGYASAYDIRYSTVEITSASFSTAGSVGLPPLPKAGGETETYELKGLEPETTYYFAVKSADETPNWSQLSNIAVGTTLALPELAVTAKAEKTTLDHRETAVIYITVLDNVNNKSVLDAFINTSLSSDDLKLDIKSGYTNEDGAITINATALSVKELTEVTIFINASKFGFLNGASNITLLINALPVEDQFDLHFSDFDESTLNKDLDVGDEIPISLKITNKGPGESSSFSVKFYVDDELYGDIETFSALLKGQSVDIVRNWTILEGEHEIRIEIIPDESDLESKLSDNTMELTIYGGTADDEPGSDKNKSSASSNSLAVFSVLIILIILIIVFLLLYISKKNLKTESDTDNLSEERAESPPNNTEEEVRGEEEELEE